MAGGGVNFTVTAKGLADFRARMKALSDEDRQELFGKLGGVLEQQVRLRFTMTKADPEGKPWQKWSDRYKDTRHENHSLLMGEGDLEDSIGYTARKTSVRVGPEDLIYARTHQLGDPLRKIPARPYLGMSNEDEAELVEVVNDWLKTKAQPQ